MCSSLAELRALLEHVAPGRADGECGINQSHVGVGLGKVPALGLCGGNEVFRKQPDMIGGRQYLVEDFTRFVHASQASKGLSDPERTDDEGAFRFPEVIVPDIPVKESGVLAVDPERQFTGDLRDRRFAQGAVGVPKNRQLRQRGVERGIRGTVPNGPLADGAEQGVFRLNATGRKAGRDGGEMSGLFDAFQSFESGPAQQIREGVLLPAVPNFPETGVRLADAADTQFRQMRQQRIEISRAQIDIPFVEEDRGKAQNHFGVGIVLHVLRGLIVAANRLAALVPRPVRMLRLGKRKPLAERIHRA